MSARKEAAAPLAPARVPKAAPTATSSDPRDAVIASERRDLRLADGEHPRGLALSGGGIRSASFALGVVQVLLERQLLERFHYLSTVSGGGYLGGALTWWRQQSGSVDEFHRRFGQLGTRRDWSRFLAMHGNYLAPPRIRPLALIGVLLRNIVLSLGVYLPMLVALLFAAICFGILPAAVSLAPAVAPLAASFGGVPVRFDVAGMIASFVGVAIVSVACGSFATFIASVGRLRGLLAGVWAVLLLSALCVTALLLARSAAAVGPASPNLLLVLQGAWSGCGTWAVFSLLLLREQLQLGPGDDAMATFHYQFRVGYQRTVGLLLECMFALWVVASLPWVAEEVSRLQTWLGLQDRKEWLAGIASVAGAAGSAFGLRGGGVKPTRLIGGSVVFVGAAMLFLYGLLFGSYFAASRLVAFAATTLGIDPYATWWLAVVTLFFAASIGFFTNLNLFGIARMYRDRLMEAFMPDPATVDSGNWERATLANVQNLGTVWPAGWTPRDGATPPTLYPLINTTAALPDAWSDGVKSRGGVNFLLSPNFCGSPVTAYEPTATFADGHLSLPTAVAISGAAVEPHSGGDGLPTRDRLVAAMMFLFQVRLGVWLRNPNPEANLMQSLLRRLTGQRPNLLYPGIAQGLLGRTLDESAGFVELADGGHFENLGVYELIARRAELIVACVASCDPNYTMEDLSILVERVQVDFGARIEFDVSTPLADLAPGSGGARRGYAIARIHYTRPDGSADPQCGYLLYLQATRLAPGLAPRLPFNVDAYAAANADFPNESTADQFFGEPQLEAYRALGVAIGQHVVDAIAAAGKDEEAAFAVRQRLGIGDHRPA